MEEKIQPIQRTEEELKEIERTKALEEIRKTRAIEEINKDIQEVKEPSNDAPKEQKELEQVEVTEEVQNELTKTEEKIEDPKFKVMLKFMWINTTLLFMVLMVVAITLISVWVTEMIAQILAFLFISLFGLGFWWRFEKQIGPLIK